MNTEDDYRSSIVSKEWLNRNIFIEAGAGAGKTTIIVKRIINQLRWSDIKAHELVVITFTRKAAAELYKRISAALAAAVQSGSYDGVKLTAEEYDRLKTAFDGIDLMNISTIHSFCRRLIEERAFDAEVPLGVRVVEADEAEMLKKQFFDEWYRKHADKGLAEKLAGYKKGAALYKFKQNAEKTFIELSSIAADEDTKTVLPPKNGYKNEEYYEKFFTNADTEIKEKLLSLAEKHEAEYDMAVEKDFKSAAAAPSMLETLYSIYSSDSGAAVLNKYLPEKVKYSIETWIKEEFIPGNDEKFKDLSFFAQCRTVVEKKLSELLRSTGRTMDKFVKSAVIKLGPYAYLKTLTDSRTDMVGPVFKKTPAVPDDILTVFEIWITDEIMPEFNNKLKEFELLKKEFMEKVTELVHSSGAVYHYLQSTLRIDEKYGFVTEMYKTLKKLPDRLLLKDCGSMRGEFCEQLKEYFDKNEKDINDFVQFGAYTVVNTAAEAAKAYNEMRQSKAVAYLTDDDLLLTAKKLICDEKNACARKYLTDKYRCIYIDEFQDTDHIQQKLLWTLACGDGSSLRDGALFVVGDPKQSIYRFRGAELEVFFKTKEDMDKLDNSEVVSLGRNYRSGEDIINWVNEKFGAAFEAYSDKPGKNIDYEEMLCCEEKKQAAEEAEVISGVYRYGGNDIVSVGEDAGELARLILSLVGKKKVRVFKDGKYIADPIRFSDFLVITRTADNVPVYMNAFRELDIPVVLGAKWEGFDDPAVGRFSILYSYLAKSCDPTELAGALQAAIGRGFFMDNEELWNDGLKKISALYESTKKMSAYALAEYLSHRLDLILPQGRMNRSEIYSAVARVRQMVNSVLGTVKGSRQTLAKAFADYRASEIKSETTLEEHPDAVSFMNLHQAKGLEGRIVIIADRRMERIRTGAHREGELYYPQAAGSDAVCKFFADAEERAYAEEEKEALRIQYVAATRAEEALIFMNRVGSKAPYWFNKFIDEELPSITADGNTARLSETSDYDSSEWASELNEEQLTACRPKLKPSSLEKHADKIAFKEDAAEAAEKADEEDEGEGVGSILYNSDKVISNVVNDDEQLSVVPKGAVFGTAMHRCFEIAVNRLRQNVPPEAYKQEAVNRALSESYDDIGDSMDAYKSRLAAMLDKFSEDEELLREIIGAEEVYTELPFSFYVYDEDKALLKNVTDEDFGERLWINGTADLVLKTGSEVLVIDYKSNLNAGNVPDFVETLAKRYEKQLELYKFAVSRLFKVNIDNIKTKIVNYQAMQ